MPSQRTPSPPVSPGAPSSIYSQHPGGGRVYSTPSSYAATQAGVHLGQSLPSAETLPPRPHSSAFFHTTAARASASSSPFADYFSPDHGHHTGDEVRVGGFDGAHDRARQGNHNRPSTSHSHSHSSSSHSSHRKACIKVDPHKPLSTSAKLGLYLMGTNQRKMEKASAQQKEKRARRKEEREMKKVRKAGKRGADGVAAEHDDDGDDDHMVGEVEEAEEEEEL